MIKLLKQWPFLVLTSMILLHAACTDRQPNGTMPISKNPIEIDTAWTAEIISNLTSLQNSDSVIWIDSIPLYSKQVIRDVYKATDNQPIWLDTINLRDALFLLDNVTKDGLLSRDYHWPAIQQLRQKIQSEKEPTHQILLKLDLLITDGLLHYADHLLNGKLDPLDFDPTCNFKKKEVPARADSLLLHALQHHRLKQSIYALRPGHTFYSNMMKSLERYRQIKEAGEWASIHFDEKEKIKIEPGEADSLIPPIKRRLQAEHYYNKYPNEKIKLYNDTLKKAIQQFQIHHGLNPDGVIGNNTLAAMNSSVQEKIDKIRMSMERGRWVFNNIGDDVVLVNIPAYRLLFYRGGSRIWETKVIVGTQYTSTPVFQSGIAYMEFNPTWTVPYSISSKEILPKLKTDSTYLARNSMQLLNSAGKAEDPGQVDFSKLSKGNFPYVIRQAPGNINALGRVKFLLPNPYSVYLHDTPSRYLFGKDDRALSHGCIRVDSPLQLARLLLNDTTNWKQETFTSILDSRKTKRVNLAKPMPIIIQYLTHFTDEKGQAFFYQDIYKRDPALLNGLNTPSFASTSAP